MSTKHFIHFFVVIFLSGFLFSCSDLDTIEEMETPNLEKENRYQKSSSSSIWTFHSPYTSCYTKYDWQDENPIFNFNCGFSPISSTYKFFSVKVINPESLISVLSKNNLNLRVFVNGSWTCAPCPPNQVIDANGVLKELTWDLTSIIPMTSINHCYPYSIAYNASFSPSYNCTNYSINGPNALNLNELVKTMCFNCSE